MRSRLGPVLRAFTLVALILFGVGAFSPSSANADHSAILQSPAIGTEVGSSGHRWDACDEYSFHNVAQTTDPEYWKHCGGRDNHWSADAAGFYNTMTDTCPEKDINPNEPGVQTYQCFFIDTTGSTTKQAVAGTRSREAFQAATEKSDLMRKAIEKGLADGRQRIGVVFQHLVGGRTVNQRMELLVDAGPNMQTFSSSTSCPGKKATITGYRFAFDPASKNTSIEVTYFHNAGAVTTCRFGQSDIKYPTYIGGGPGISSACGKSYCTGRFGSQLTPDQFPIRMVAVNEGQARDTGRLWGPSVAYGQNLEVGFVEGVGKINGATPLRLVDAPSSGDQVFDPAQTRAIYDQMKTSPYYNQASAPSAPVAPPETDPDADPDHDGVPNRTDDDDDGDGLPDPDDPNFTVPDYPPFTSPDADPDGDGDPNTTDPDDDNDGYPDEQDPKPYDPWPSPHRPDADPDGDGEPNTTDPDDDGDGIPDPEDPNPAVPTDPATLPVDHPYADPDRDGQPNGTDPDDDNDGIPDPEDPDPFRPTDPGSLPDDHPYADPDKDGQPNKTDADDDGDGWPDPDDPAPHDPAQPGGDPQRGPDADRDGWPQTLDPAPDNPAVPKEEPYLDGDDDGYPDPMDPAPTDPAQPQPSPAPNPDGDSWPSPVDPAPNDASVPAAENPYQPPQETAMSCPIPRKPQVSIPNLRMSGVFPFNLVVWAWQALKELHTEPAYPVYELPGFGTLDFGTMAGMFAAVRVVITGLLLIALVAGWYTYIRGSEA